ncbi:MAG: hypothetical protein KAR19_03890 [Bacteroidales bacterium]|nr:hypothetical protein [Bacteroidales bacterium]
MAMIFSIALTGQIYAQSETKEVSIEEYGGNNDWEKDGQRLIFNQNGNYIPVKGSAWHIAVADISYSKQKGRMCFSRCYKPTLTPSAFTLSIPAGWIPPIVISRLSPRAMII